MSIKDPYICGTCGNTTDNIYGCRCRKKSEIITMPCMGPGINE